VSRRRLALLLSAALTATLAPVAVAAAPAERSGYDATIRETEYGIPHIAGKDFADVGYGYGYKLASETICTMADTYTTVRGQRSKFFGENGSYVFRGNGRDGQQPQQRLLLPADHRRPAGREAHGAARRRTAPAGGARAGHRLRRRLQPLARRRGRRRGRHRPGLRRQGARHPDHRDRRVPALLPAGPARQLRRRHRRHRRRQPPHPSAPLPSTQMDHESTARLLDEQWKTLAIGSNAVALGKDATRTARGCCSATRTSPWIGSERFYQAHLTGPGKLDVTGGSLLGVPLVLIGHTEKMAWSHTVSTAFRFTPFQLTLVPGLARRPTCTTASRRP
jgi:acyl-homoserine-lactone acylase